MHFLAVSLRKDWARVLRDPSQFAIALGIPLVLAVLMSLVFGRERAAPQGRLLVADEDNSIASNILLDVFRTGPLSKTLPLEKVTRDAGRARLDRGGASAFLLIPQGFQWAFLANEPFELQLVTNPSQQILPEIAVESVSTALDGAFYLRRMAGSRPENVASASFPSLIGLETAVARPSQPPRSFAAVFLPSMLFMGLLFIASGAAADIWKERTLGTLGRMAVSPVSIASYLVARIVFVAMLYGAAALFGLAAARWLAGMPVPNLAAAAGWMTFTGTVFYLFFLWITVQPATPRAASVLVNLIIFPLAMLGGSFFPFEWMPAWMVRIGRLTPNGLALASFKTILDGTQEPARIATAGIFLAAFAALAFVLTLRRLRGSFAD